MKKYIEGLKFGLLLQFAVGPMCLMVFNTAQNTGFFVAMSLVIAIALVDAFYILLASLGASKLLGNEKVEKVVKIVGAIVLMIFGLNIILNVFGINIIPGLNLNPNSSSAFIQGIILTLSKFIIQDLCDLKKFGPNFSTKPVIVSLISNFSPFSV